MAVVPVVAVVVVVVAAGVVCEVDAVGAAVPLVESALRLPPVASSTWATSSRSSGMAVAMFWASTSRNEPKACILPRISWLPRRTSSTNSRV